MKIYYWPQRGLFEDSEKDKKCFYSLNAALEYVVNSHSGLGFLAFNITDLYFYHYSYDYRIENDFFALCSGKYYDKDFLKIYKCPQIIGFFSFDFSKLFVETPKNLFFDDPYFLKSFLINHFDVSSHDIEVFGKYCHFVIDS